MKKLHNAYCVLSLEAQRKKYSFEEQPISPYTVGIPLLECSDPQIEQTYYYRWHTFCRHLKKTPAGYVVTEFLPPVPWAGIYNTINCPAGHHFYEGRWLHDPRYLSDYARFWFTPEAEPRKYSFWAGDAITAFTAVHGLYTLEGELYEPLRENYRAWQREKGTSQGLYWQSDNYDGMEYSIGGGGLRPTINSYQYGDALALSRIAQTLGRQDEAQYYRQEAEQLKERINRLLWDESARFYKTRDPKTGELASVRELIGYVPWYFSIPPEDRADAWQQLKDPQGFFAPYGPTTAERRHPDFMKEYDHECLWNGPSWPFATSQMLTAMGNLLRSARQSVLTEEDYLEWLQRYAHCHKLTQPDGIEIPFIDEDLHPDTGKWLTREILLESQPPRADAHRGEHYNHSTFCDLVITGLAGLQVRRDNVLSVHPLFSSQQLQWLCVDGIFYRGHSITVLWDADSQRYRLGAGLKVFCDGRLIAEADRPGPICAALSRA